MTDILVRKSPSVKKVLKFSDLEEGQWFVDHNGDLCAKQSDSTFFWFDRHHGLSQSGATTDDDVGIAEIVDHVRVIYEVRK